MKPLTAYVDADCAELHLKLQRALNFDKDGIPLPRSKKGYNFSSETRLMIKGLARKHGIKLRQ